MISILGVMAAVAVPNLLPLVHAGKLSGTALQVAGFVDSTRTRAVAEGRCYRLKVVGASLVQERRTGTDCVNLSEESWEGPLRALPIPGATFAIASTVADDATDGANHRLVFRPSSRLRGDGDLDVTDDHARVSIRLAGVEGSSTVEIMATGRTCTRKFPGSPPAVAVFACQ